MPDRTPNSARGQDPKNNEKQNEKQPDLLAGNERLRKTR